MSLTITKFDVAKFDVDHFDYTISTDTFETIAQSDVDEILLAHGRVFTIERATNVVDSLGRTSSITNTEFTIYAMMQDITKKDRVIHDMGLAVAGNVKMYMNQSYSITSAGVATTYTPKEGDVLRDADSRHWKIVQIMGERYSGNSMIFKVAILRNIDLSGT